MILFCKNFQEKTTLGKSGLGEAKIDYVIALIELMIPRFFSIYPFMSPSSDTYGLRDPQRAELI